LSDDKPLLVFFTSERSGPARRMESLLAHLARKERTRVRIMRVAVEDQPELAEKFRVTDVPTLVLVKRKRVVDSPGTCRPPPRRLRRRLGGAAYRPSRLSRGGRFDHAVGELRSEPARTPRPKSI
jgi:thioredoxin 1